MHFISIHCLLKQTCGTTNHAANVATRIARHDAQQTLTSFLGQVGLLEHTLGGVEVRQVKGGAGMTRIEDGGESHTGLEGCDHDTVHLVVDNVTGRAEIHWIDDLVVAIIFVAVEILGLTAVA